MSSKRIIFPTPVIHLEIVKSNILNMSLKAKKYGIEFRPHFKTHQSVGIGEFFKEYGLKGITVSSLKMADYFSIAGWKDITVAFPLNVNAFELYDKINFNSTLKSLVVSKESVIKLDSEINHAVGLYIELDPFYGRSGLPFDSEIGIQELISVIERSKNFYFIGFYSHAGNTYKCKSELEILSLANKVFLALNILKEKYPKAEICFGDTPSSSILNDFGPITQMSPGNFVFYDWMHYKIGSCNLDQIAFTVKCPIIEKYEERGELLIHGGAVHFSKESSVTMDGKIHFGVIKGSSKGRLETITEENILTSISQEHGIVRCTKEFYDSVQIGDYVEIIPIHSCLTADLFGYYLNENGIKIDHLKGSLFNYENI